MRDRRYAYRILVGKHDRKIPLAKPMHKWKIILILIFKKYDGEVWNGLLRLGMGTDSGLL
jgi:hypothetical protein